MLKHLFGLGVLGAVLFFAGCSEMNPLSKDSSSTEIMPMQNTNRVGAVAKAITLAAPSVVNPERYLGLGYRKETTQLAAQDIQPTSVSVTTAFGSPGSLYDICETQDQFSKAVDTKIDASASGKYTSIQASASFSSSVKNTVSYTSKTTTLLVTVKVMGKINMNNGTHGSMGSYLLNANDVNSSIRFNQYFGNQYVNSAQVGGVLFYVWSTDYSSGTTTTASEVRANLQLKYKDIAEGSLTVQQKTDMESFFSRYRNTGRFISTTGLDNQILVTSAGQYQQAYNDFIAWYQAALNGDSNKQLTIFDFTLQDYWLLAPSSGQPQYASDRFKKIIVSNSAKSTWVSGTLYMTTNAQLYTNGDFYRSTTTRSMSWLYGFKGQVRTDALNQYGSTVFTGQSSTYGQGANGQRTDVLLQVVPSEQLSNPMTIRIVHAKVG